MQGASERTTRHRRWMGEGKGGLARCIPYAPQSQPCAWPAVGGSTCATPQAVRPVSFSTSPAVGALAMCREANPRM